ncbi:MAG TPA: IS3 family transposase [Alphaproteobacteria bacterium]|nr:IS3 family transposase [Alphaproteobacteria bacterium]
MGTSGKRYPAEYRRQMVELVRSGRTAESLGREFEPSAETIRNWVRRAEQEESHGGRELTPNEREELNRLRRENQRLREEREILKKAGGLVRSGEPVDRTRIFRFVRMNRADHAVTTLCRVLSVSAGGYYRWRARPLSARRVEDEILREKIEAIHQWSRSTYGAPRIHAHLRGKGWRVGCKRVARLMREVGLRGVSRRPWPQTTVRNERARPAPDLVERDFSADGPNRLWVADITYVPITAGFLYLAVVLDAWSRRVVGWAMERHLRTELVLQALDMALWRRRPEAVIHHSDQGSQYTSIAFGQRCRRHGVRPSMGSVGDCYDNALCESFFATLECELIDRHRFPTAGDAKRALFDYIEGWYNPHRLHSALGYRSPVQFEGDRRERRRIPN